MSDFDHNLRSYNEIRSSLRNICLWLLSEDKYTQHFHTKDKTFRESKKLIEAFLPKDFLLTKTMGHQTINYCRYDMFDRTEEYLAHTFQKCTFTENDIIFYFGTMSCLEDGQLHSISQILDMCDTLVESTKLSTLSVENLRNHLNEMVKEGIICRHGEGKNL